ncbi:hypothetical protein ACLKMY_07210 [Paraburkholderia mimosarum]
MRGSRSESAGKLADKSVRKFACSEDIEDAARDGGIEADPPLRIGLP